MNIKKILFFLFACVALSLPSIAMARSRVGTNAGCGQEFRGNKGAIKNCRACLKKGGYFKKSSRRKSWSCKIKAAKKKVIKKAEVVKEAPVKRVPNEVVKEAMAKTDPLSKEQIKHVERIAKIDRLAAIAKESGADSFMTEVAALRAKENERHEKMMTRIHTKRSK